MIQVDKETRGFRPTIEWMQRKYDELNNELFDGCLGPCQFHIFTNGKGSQGRRLGSFKMTSTGIQVWKNSRRMFKIIYDDYVYINPNNFAKLCEPLISLNGNYSGTEYGFLATLVHEMCHYYTYMKGYALGKAHGPEFYHIGNTVALKSGGLFTIDKLASAEEMLHLDLDDKIKQTVEKRIANKKAKIYALFDYKSPDDIRLVTTNNQALINAICDFQKRNKTSKQVIITNDAKVIDLLFEKGYKKNFRTWRYWQVAGKEWLGILDDAEKEILKNPAFMTENKRRNINDIINETFNRFINEKLTNIIEITPDMDLGAYSPFQIEN